MRTQLFRFLDLCRILGVSQTVRLAARWAVRREFLVFRRNLDGGIPISPPIQSVECRSLADGETRLLRSLDPAMSGSEIQRRRREGQHCQVTWIGTCPVHYVWWADRPVNLPYLGREFRLRPGDLLVVDSFTHPGFRKQGIHTLAMRRLLAQAGSAGFDRCFSLIAWWNIPVVRAAHRIGGGVIGTVGYRTVGLARRYFATGNVHVDGNRVWSDCMNAPETHAAARQLP